jgi:general stress protein 26
MMVTHKGGNISARPMQGIPRPEQNAIWFFSDLESQQDHEPESSVCLTFSDVKTNKFVSVSGRITPVLERDTIHDLWNEGADSYFPKGPDDPAVILLRFDPESGAYWDAPSSPIVLAIKFLEAKITGDRPNLGTSGTARLK